MFANKWGVCVLAQFCYEEIQKPDFLREFAEWQKKKDCNQIAEKQKTAEQSQSAGGTNGKPI